MDIIESNLFSRIQNDPLPLSNVEKIIVNTNLQNNGVDCRFFLFFNALPFLYPGIKSSLLTV